MNRAQRRRLEKLQGKPGPSRDSFAVATLLDEAKSHHQAGRLQEAEHAYRLVLQMSPEHPEALHALGLLAYRVGKLDLAGELLGRAVQQHHDHPLYCFNFGVVLQRAGRFEEAISAYQRAISAKPEYVEALTNLGNVYKELGQLARAEQAYRKALRVNPSYADAYNNLGAVLKEQGLVDQAIDAYRQALAVKPGHVEAYNNLGLALMERGEWEKAAAAFEQALRSMPGYVKATYNLGIVSIWRGQFDRALSCLDESARVKQDHGRRVTEILVSKSRLRHDAEQIQYLFKLGILGHDHAVYRDALRRLDQQARESASTATRIRLDQRDLDLVAPSFNRVLHRAACERLPGGAVNPDLDVEAIEARYNAKRPEIIYIDDLLTGEALTAMRRFCLESTIWKKDYENGYLGAFLGDGFATPLLLQIAEELRLKFPGIFKQHRLTQAWAFKYDSRRRGLNVHADAAAVNVNFWITPDEANLDPETGGLVVWDKEAPRDWNFREYNNDRNRQKIFDWLASAGAKAVRIPYRANRAVVFNSDLFHETDRFSFKDEYASRRINITLLYGHRLNA
ncbi:MAG: tetratricopeptide repeat protein [Nitrospirota bacterium]